MPLLGCWPRSTQIHAVMLVFFSLFSASPFPLLLLPMLLLLLLLLLLVLVLLLGLTLVPSMLMMVRRVHRRRPPAAAEEEKAQLRSVQEQRMKESVGRPCGPSASIKSCQAFRYDDVCVSVCLCVCLFRAAHMVTGSCGCCAATGIRIGGKEPR